MKIVINGQQLMTSEFHGTGPYVYTYNIVNSLAKIDKENKYLVYVSDQYERSGSFEELTANNPNFEMVVIEKSKSFTQIGVSKQLLKDKPDLYFTPVHTLPLIRPFKTKVVSMIHGLEYKYNPKVSGKISNRWLFFPLWFTALFSEKIIVPSDETKSRILSSMPLIDPKKITIIGEGVSDNFIKTNPEEIDRVKSKFGIKTPKYLLFVSTIQPRKNVVSTVKAFSQALKGLENPQDYTFVFVGKNGWDFQESLEAPWKYGVSDKVIFTGFVEDRDLLAFFSGAHAYVNFSLEEGFCLPLLEALKIGSLCLVSDLKVLRQLGNDACIYADPLSVDSMAQTLKEAMLNSFDAKAKIELGLSISANYTWRASAEKTLEVFKSATI